MLIVANGAYKSGSTWMYYILKQLRESQSPPPEFLAPWKHPSLDPAKAAGFLQTGMHRTQDFLVKQHMGRQDLLPLIPLIDDQVVLFDIVRDPRDVVVSAYHHAIRSGFQGSFRRFYWLTGREVHRDVKQYHQDFVELIPSKNRIVLSYENLKVEFAAELQPVLAALGVTLPPDRMRDLEEATSFRKMRDVYNDDTVIHGKDFFRKGVIGDFENHYGPLEEREGMSR